MTRSLRSGRIPGLIALGILLVLLAGTAGATLANEVPLAGMANPASVNCANAGGTLEIITETSGNQYGMCTFPDGKSCEEWALFRGEGCKAAPAEKQMVTFKDEDNGKTVEVVQGTRFAISLADNPTTGFRWLDIAVSPGLKIMSTEYQMDAAPEGMHGVGGTRTWEIYAKEPGNKKFSGSYYPSWNPETCGENTFVLDINVVKTL